MKNNRPCLNCPDRYPGCHDHCEKSEYLAERDQRKRIMDAKAYEHAGKKQTAHWMASKKGRIGS